MNLDSFFTESEFDGLLVLSDIHSEYSKLLKANSYATENNLLILLLGDIVDGGEKSGPICKRRYHGTDTHTARYLHFRPGPEKNRIITAGDVDYPQRLKSRKD